MKKRIACLTAACLLCLSALLPASAAEENDLAGTTINVFNWGEYISDGTDGTLDVNAEFTKRTGIKVNYNFYESNEVMYTKLKNAGASYDIIIPSDYMIERLIAEDMVQKIDFSHIPNYQYIAEEYKNLYFDPDNAYSVPYNVGTVCLIYNTKVVTEPPASWDVLWDEKYADQILMFNNPRDAFGIAQYLLGQNVNTTDPDDWNAAAEKLKEQKPLVKSYVMDEVYNKMEAGEAALAPYYAGDFITMHDNNPDLAFAYPKEGTNIFVDSVCIPQDAKNKRAAELYINFLLDPEIAKANAETIGYATPNTAVREMEDYELAGNPAIYPDAAVLENTQYFHNLPQDNLTLMSALWESVKTSGNDNTAIYVGFLVVVAFAIALVIYRAIKKKRREA